MGRNYICKRGTRKDCHLFFSLGGGRESYILKGIILKGDLKNSVKMGT